MDAPEPVTPTPDAAPPPSSVSAVDAAVAKSPSEYRTARAHERAGTPLPDVAAPAAAGEPAPSSTPDGAVPAAATPPKPVSKRALDESERTRKAVEAALKDARRQWESEVSQRTAPPDSAAVPRPEPAKPTEFEFPELEDWSNDPANAGKSIGAYNRAMLAAHTKFLEGQQQARQAETQARTIQQQTDDTFAKALSEAKGVDAEFVTKLSPEVMDLAPRWAPAHQGKPVGPRTILTEQIMTSPYAAKLLVHFSEHPEAFSAFDVMPDAIRALPPDQAVRQHVAHILRQFGKLEAQFDTSTARGSGRDSHDESTTARGSGRSETPGPKLVSDAPDPPVRLGTRPTDVGSETERAVKSGSTSAYRQARLKERIALSGRR